MDGFYKLLQRGSSRPSLVACSRHTSKWSRNLIHRFTDNKKLTITVQLQDLIQRVTETANFSNWSEISYFTLKLFVFATVLFGQEENTPGRVFSCVCWIIHRP